MWESVLMSTTLPYVLSALISQPIVRMLLLVMLITTSWKLWDPTTLRILSEMLFSSSPDSFDTISIFQHDVVYWVDVIDR